MHIATFKDGRFIAAYNSDAGLCFASYALTMFLDDMPDIDEDSNKALKIEFPELHKKLTEIQADRLQATGNNEVTYFGVGGSLIIKQFELTPEF